MNIIVPIQEDKLFKDKEYRRELEQIMRKHTSVRGEFRQFIFEDGTEAVLLIKDYYLVAVDQNPYEFMKVFNNLDKNGPAITNYIYPNFSTYKQSDFNYMKFCTENILNNQISSKIKLATKDNFRDITEEK